MITLNTLNCYFTVVLLFNSFLVLTLIYFVFSQEAECVQPAEELDHIFKVEQIHQFFQEFEEIFPFLDISDLSNNVE